ncbi:Adenosine deaminase-like protein [Triticum urartu]|uniref:Adenosine deaminase-like protein n=1 Tax=Triticum urartu TaxID=4572 RepID=M7YRS3_TRIUA|nr:Adenosine deaminase-like protein [Triticum urartu]
METQTSEAEKEMREWCVALPKVELHAHLNGSVRNSTLLELAKELGDKGVIVLEDVKDVIMKSHKSVEDVDVLLNNEKLSCTPMSDLGGDTKRKKIYVRLLLSIDRHETTSAALDTVNLAMEMKDQGVIGIDLSGNPVVGEWETYLPALEHAKELGIPTTIHCGEVPNRKEIQAMLDFCPQRLGHVCCLDDEEWKKLKSSVIPVEICLTSNVMTGGTPSLERHHFGLYLTMQNPKSLINKTNPSKHLNIPSFRTCAADLYNAKHPLSICTDDCGLFSTSLSNEYYLAASTFGLSKTELFRLAQGAVEFMFADDEVKKSLRAVFERAAAERLTS